MIETILFGIDPFTKTMIGACYACVGIAIVAKLNNDSDNVPGMAMQVLGIVFWPVLLLIILAAKIARIISP